MERKQIILIVVSLIIIIGIVLLIVNLKKQKVEYIPNRTEPVLDSTELSNTEQDIQTAISECREMFKNYGNKNFDVYFSIDFINSKLSNENMNLITSDVFIQDDFVKIYDNVGNEIEEIPSINYARNLYSIEPYKNYLIKVYSYNNSYSYYYTMNIDKIGYATLEMQFYTIGEENPMHDSILNLNESEI